MVSAFFETVEHPNHLRAVHAIINGFSHLSRLENPSGLHQGELL
jgi:hypothetical protein